MSQHAMGVLKMCSLAVVLLWHCVIVILMPVFFLIKRHGNIFAMAKKEQLVSYIMWVIAMMSYNRQSLSLAVTLACSYCC